MEVRERVDDRLQPVAVTRQAHGRVVHLDVVGNELGELGEPVLVASLQVARIERVQLSAIVSHGTHAASVERYDGAPTVPSSSATSIDTHIRPSQAA